MSETAEFKIPKLRMPTPEEHREVSLAWLKRVQPTLIDQWPSELTALSMPTKLVKVDAITMFEEICSLHDGKEMGPYLPALALELDRQIGWDRKFVRLNSRSPKDWPWPFHVPATISGKEAVSILSGSERVLDDLLEFKYVPEQPCFICLRDWVHWISGENEFRCFVKDGRLIAVTHYDYTKPAPERLAVQGTDIRAKIDTYFIERLRPTLPIDTVVFDVALNYDGELLLIEINPYGLSDPCWFGSYAAVENANEPVQFAPPTQPREGEL